MVKEKLIYNYTFNDNSNISILNFKCIEDEESIMNSISK